MRKADVQMTLKKGVDESVAPPSPIIPTKRSKANPEQVVPEPRPGYPTPSPPVFIRKMRNAAVGTGCDIRLKVTVAGDPQPSLYWYHNDDLLNMDNQEYGGLWIRDCKPSDAGLYTCIANNHLGEARTSAVLAVLDLGEGKVSKFIYCFTFTDGKILALAPIMLLDSKCLLLGKYEDILNQPNILPIFKTNKLFEEIRRTTT